MPMPSAAHMRLAGFGATSTGEFSVGENRGTYRRFALNADVEVAVESPLTRYRAGGTFTLSGADFDSAVRANCLSTEGRWVTASAETSIEPFRYECRLISEGRAIGDLVIAQSSRSVGPGVAGPTRRGFIRLDGLTYLLRPIHRLAGTSVEAVDPVGYELVIDGVLAGAFPIFGAPKEIVAMPNGRRAVMLSAICFSLWID